MTKVRRLERVAMGIFSGGEAEHGKDPDKPWEVSDAEREKIKQANEEGSRRKIGKS
jgi:hypothetical protein